ncbi:MAG: ABC transporter permease, partial [Sphaerochaetaceae bacterium]|nr:ABC transporter permease [Sphaerochaetaceae bacterium]
MVTEKRNSKEREQSTFSLLVFFQKIIKRRESAIFLALVGIMVIITIVAPQFATGGNIYRVSRQISLVAIASLGVFTVILTGGIDLSLGSTIGLSGVTCGLAMAGGVHPLFAILIGMLTGFSVGIINGLLVSYVGITPFIVTLGMLSIARGTIWIITKGWPIENIDDRILVLGQGELLGIPVPVIIMVVVAILIHFLMRLTVFGRRVYAIGGNEEATRLSGVDVQKIKCLVYGIS